MNSTQTDRIEKRIVLRAPRSRVWRALTDSQEFGSWFGCVMQGPFTAGATVRGEITHPEYKGKLIEIVIDQVQPETLFSWRWHPAAIEDAVDYSVEPMTHVVFELAEVPGGTQLTVVESGFDRVPLSRQATAYRMNQEGWTFQLGAIEKYVAG